MTKFAMSGNSDLCNDSTMTRHIIDSIDHDSLCWMLVMHPAYYDYRKVQKPWQGLIVMGKFRRIP